MNKTYTVRRVFAEELEKIEKMYTQFDFLHFNPYKRDFLEEILLCGQIWAAYDGDDMAACSCIFPGDMAGWCSTAAKWNAEELLDIQGINYAVAGYTACKEKIAEGEITALFCRLWQSVALKRNIEKVLYLHTAHIHTDMGQILSAGFRLAGLRGLDRLVPHYIFIRETNVKNHPEEKATEIKKCPPADTKEISRLCEQGFYGYDTDAEGNIIFTCRR